MVAKHISKAAVHRCYDCNRPLLYGMHCAQVPCLLPEEKKFIACGKMTTDCHNPGKCCLEKDHKNDCFSPNMWNDM